MAVEAAKKALEMAGTDAADLDMIIVGTISPDMQMPSCAVLVQAKLGAKRAFAFDVSAACAGSLYGLAIADKFIRTGAARRVLVIGAELPSRIVDWTDRNTCVLFGDAAGAFVGPRSEPRSRAWTDIHASSFRRHSGPGHAVHFRRRQQSIRNPRKFSPGKCIRSR